MGTTCSQLIHTTTERSTQSILTSTHKSTLTLLTTPLRSTLALLTTPGRSTHVELTAAAKLCMDDQFFNCQNPVMCESEFRNNCPLSCGICVPEPTTTKKPCIDNILLNCQDHSICLSKLSHHCPATCDMCVVSAIQTTTKRSTKALLTTTHRSTLALLTTTHRSTQMIPTAAAKLCMDDQFFNCQNPGICKSEFRNNCPLSCRICVPEPTTTKKPCIDNILLNCQDHSICLSKLSQHCPATCGMCVVSGSVFKGAVPILNLANPHHYLPATTQSQDHRSVQTTQGTIARGAVQHTCNKIGLLMDLAMGKSLHQQSAKGCGGNSSDAVVIKHCQAPSFSKWRKGFEVTSNCSHINHYTPVAEWDSQGFTDNIGVITFCHSGVIEMITQTCGGNILLRNITTPASKSFYTVDWV
ncbi:uncharacterized protein LOC143057099 isoform X4 [Mytilus galloprovincialis]|uniref:uncharacterized protein LOC143057099 isoform X4 n=1 Tax=Mytilus galloprovincialis TaxID=29158 RepID=UPI003F7C1D9A